MGRVSELMVLSCLSCISLSASFSMFFLMSSVIDMIVARLWWLLGVDGITVGSGDGSGVDVKLGEILDDMFLTRDCRKLEGNGACR